MLKLKGSWSFFHNMKNLKHDRIECRLTMDIKYLALVLVYIIQQSVCFYKLKR